MRSTLFNEDSINEAHVQALSLAEVCGDLGQEHISLTGDLLVDPSYKGRTVASLLVTRGYQLGLELEVELNILLAELSMVHLYQQLGYRPFIAPNRALDRHALRVPMALTMRDAMHLVKVKSPLRRFLAADCDDGGKLAETLERLTPSFHTPPVDPRAMRSLWAKLAESTLQRKEYSLFDDLEEDQVQVILAMCPQVDLPRGETIYELGETEQGMGMVLEGELGVTLESGPDPHLIAVLGPGQVFGEMAGVLGVGRTARLVALEASKVLLLPDTAFELLEMEDPPVGRQLARNLVRILCERLLAMNKLVGGSKARPEERIRPATPVTLSMDDAETSDPTALTAEATLQKREREALAGQELEGHWLRRLGILGENLQVVHVGAGPGNTAVFLASLFPGSTVTGVEPDNALLQHAIRRATDLSISTRCRFESGSAEALPVERDSVDFAYARLLLHKLEDPAKAVSEMERITRPGGMVAALDLDDGAIVVYPEPAGFREFQNRAAHAREDKGGNRRIGRQMSTLFSGAGLEDVRVEMLPLTSGDLPIDLLMDVAFGAALRLIQATGRQEPGDEEMVRTLVDLGGRTDAWVAIPLFMAHGRVPSTDVPAPKAETEAESEAPEGDGP
jgi:CRP-like cAMP-binding protein